MSTGDTGILEVIEGLEYEIALAEAQGSPEDREAARLKAKLAETMRRVSQIKPDCRCDGRGMRLSPLGKREFCSCEVGKAKQVEWEQKYPERLQERALELWRGFGIPERMQGLRTSTSPLLDSHGTLVRRLVSAITEANRPQEVPSLYISGPYGSGKTGLAVSLARHFCQHFADRLNANGIVFEHAPGLFARLRSTYSNASDLEEYELLELYQNASLLIFDDLGENYSRENRWLTDRLYTILGQRHLDLLPTVITSNVPFGVIEHRVGEAIAWRIREACSEDNIIDLRDGEVPQARIKTAPTTGVENHRQGTTQE